MDNRTRHRSMCCRVSARELCRKHAISDATFYTWRKKYGGMEVPEVKRLKSLEEE
ncbi:transposase, partial [Rahnella variigena]|uniref:transposase n=1 Tax=Rahnella variigena TaxID=574964 RepID=UPI00132F7BFB